MSPELTALILSTIMCCVQQEQVGFNMHGCDIFAFAVEHNDVH